MSINRQLVKIILLIGAILFGVKAYAITAYLSPQQINEGDTTKLIIEVQSNTPSLHDFDTSALEQDFEILGTSSSVQSVQNQSTLTYEARWEIELFPLKSGELAVPALDINGRFTPKLNLTVNKATDYGSGKTQNVFVEIDAEPKDPYVGQQINVTVRLFHNIRIVNGTLSEPEAINSDIYRVGNDISYQQTVNGTRYNVLERSFALFANSTGEMNILPISFRGQIEDKTDNSSSAFSSFLRQVRQIKRSSKELTLTVREIPASYTGKFWLPANDLRISDEWSDQGDELQVGDSVSRVIKLIADGLPAESLPDNIMRDSQASLNVYPDKVSRNNQDIGKKLVGRAEQKYALIMSQAGYLELPELIIKWWDVDEDVEKQASLAAKTLIVNGDVVQPALQQAQTDQSPEPVVSVSPAANSIGPNYWRWMALLFLVLWLVTMGFLFRKKIIQEQPSNIGSASDPNWDKKALEQACRNNDSVQARNQLIAWARTTWPRDNITGLYQLKTKVSDPELIQELDKLDAVLFSQNASDWSAAALMQAFSRAQANLHQSKDSATGNIIPPLYAQQS